MIVEIGIIKLKMYDSTICTKEEVQRVKYMKKNLLSRQQLDEIGCKTYIKNGIMQVVKGVIVTLKVKKITTNL